MEFDDESSDAHAESPDFAELAPHLAALIGALQGPADLGANHDRYLTYPHDEDSELVLSLRPSTKPTWITAAVFAS
ncbi:hypothetical protein [Herbidospora sp. RD11066]